MQKKQDFNHRGHILCDYFHNAMLLLASNQTSIEFPVFGVLISPHPDDVLGPADGAGDAVPDSARASQPEVGGEPDLRIFTSKTVSPSGIPK